MSGVRQAFMERAAGMAAPPTTFNRMTLYVGGGVLVSYFAGMVALGAAPWDMLARLPRLFDIVRLMFPPTPGSMAHFWTYLEALGETLAIAFVGTTLASVFALPLGFLAAKNVVTGRIVHFLSRRVLDSVRSVDTLIWALIWINVVGLGPFAGALAIASSDFGALAKLMSEAIETADRGPVEGVIASGGGRWHVVRFGLLPQVLPVFASQMLYYFESNTRSATIIGIVGAGGIGLYLSEMIRVLEWQEAAFLILMVLVAVAAIDVVSRYLRAAIMGARRA
jgi:phosphonate transport system permease protein